MKLHVGVDVGSGNIKTLAAGPANEHDLGRAAQLIQDDDDVVYGDAGYTGIEKRPEIQCGFKKTVYRGIEKNLNRLYILAASANLYGCVRAGRDLIPIQG